MTGAVLIADATVPHDDGSSRSRPRGRRWTARATRRRCGARERPSLLARMTAEVLEPVALGEPIVVVGWTLGQDGRKHESATALLSADGRMLARSRALWIELRA